MLPTAMIVDDNKEMRETLKSMVNDLVTVVDECEDGGEVMQHYRLSHPDFVLMDIAMKSVDGIRATRTLIKEFPEAKVVIVSNYGDDEMKQEAHDAGSIGFVQKEYLKELRSILTR